MEGPSNGLLPLHRVMADEVCDGWLGCHGVLRELADPTAQPTCKPVSGDTVANRHPYSSGIGGRSRQGYIRLSDKRFQLVSTLPSGSNGSVIMCPIFE
jgi:hypothetical protein